jgi:hypothetical protein
MDRRQFVKGIIPAFVAPAVQVTEDVAVAPRYLGATCFVVIRGNQEFCGVQTSDYCWTLYVTSEESWCRRISVSFYGKDARENAIAAAREYVEANDGGWPALKNPNAWQKGFVNS